MNRYPLIIITVILLTLLQAAPLTAQLVDVSHLLQGAPVQEKAYLHLDNNCYFKGDTIWYKAYVVRADNNTYTDMSRILYVELVSPDGMVVERQNHIVTARGLGDGCFALTDSLYSGYYELRAYTRWMLNFGVSSQPHTFSDSQHFYNKQMADDYFRRYDGLFSRVIPVYERPRQEGDYSQRVMSERPKTRLERDAKPALNVSFYPEGGHLIAGQRCTVAFEATDQEGKAVNTHGTLFAEGKQITLNTIHQGRGVVTFDVPHQGKLHASFEHDGRKYDFNLPDIERDGCALHVTQEANNLRADISLGERTSTSNMGIALLSRGVLQDASPLHFAADNRTSHVFQLRDLTTGVYNVVVYDEQGSPQADRLVFVNLHEYDAASVTVSHQTQAEQLQPLQPVTLDFSTDPSVGHLSISVRDRLTQDLTYDSGNMLTDLLLSSELKGFVAHPDYYFEADDEDHRQALDLLMMVQGWRRYDFATLANSTDSLLRYQPEQYMTVEGCVHRGIDFRDMLPEEAAMWMRGAIDYFAGEDSTYYDTYRQRYKTPIKEEATVVGELILADEIADVEMQTSDGGHFTINIPPYYGDAVLFLRAQKAGISDKKQHKLETRGRTDETQWPEFYVKRDLFYPIYANPYSFYQTHQPELDSLQMWADDIHLSDSQRLSSMDRELEEIEISKRKRYGRHAIDYTKPVCTYDAYELYNLVTDYGLSFGKLNFRYFPQQIVNTVLGNYDGSGIPTRIAARMSNGEHNDIFYRNFKPESERGAIANGVGDDEITTAEVFTNEGTSLVNNNSSDYALARNLYLYRLDQIRIFTDFELRNPDKHLEHTNEPDVTVDFVLMPNDSRRYSYRDRRIVLPGFYMPTACYNPDYSRTPLPVDAHDYRRTLYWNANAPVDAEGRCSVTFYNNSTARQLHISVAGLSGQGQPVVLEEVLY